MYLLQGIIVTIIITGITAIFGYYAGKWVWKDEMYTDAHAIRCAIGCGVFAFVFCMKGVLVLYGIK